MKKLLFLLLIPLLLGNTGGHHSALRKGHDYAVFFYVSTFQPGWQPLPDTQTEAEALTKVLESDYGFEVKLVANPSRQQIYDEIADWNERLGPDDQVLFFFSMHGYYDPGSELGYLIAADGLYRDDYYKTWLDYNSLRPYFAKCKAKHMLIALDACYSGSFGNIERAPDRPAYDEGQDCQTQIDASFQFRVRQYICSGNKDSKTPGKSLFAAKLLEALRQNETNGILHFDDLTYTLGKVRNPEPVHGSFTGHTPGGEFIFIRKNACAQQPDRDGDTVPDALDQCPDTWGSQANGCPSELPKSDDTARDLALWKTAKQQNTETAYRDYLRQFPQGEFKEQANQALRTLEAAAARRRDDTAWEIATEKNTQEDYKKYIADYPDGLHRSEADAKINVPASVQTNEKERTDNMVLIKGGMFEMGSDKGIDEMPLHRVTVSDFYLAKYELTIAEFKAFVDATGYKTDADKEGSSYVYTNDWKEQKGVNWKYDTRGNLRPSNEYNHPVVHVSWNDAVAYCEWLSKETGLKYRLPTEAEWEYAAGGGSNGRTQWSGTSNESTLIRYANYSGNQDGYANTAPVGSLQANFLNLYDMTGNVLEWCSDWYGSNYYYSSPSKNPTGPASGSYRVQRGGAWHYNPESCRVADRFFVSSSYRSLNAGFRLARTK
jgi:sulfatase modifying factor 1